MTLEALKQQAAMGAVALVQSGMVLGLGTGSTANYAISAIGEKLERGELRGIEGVATSEASATLARQLGIPLIELSERGVDLSIDGMDELTPDLNATKGLGGALTREKIVAATAQYFVLIGDETKQVARLGERTPIPVEVIPFGWRATRVKLESLCEEVSLRVEAETGEAFVTDNFNYILDCKVAPVSEPQVLAEVLCNVPGVVEHGLFLDMAAEAFIATSEGVLSLERPML